MTGNRESADDLRAMHAAIQRLTSGPVRPDELIELLTLHPASRSKLRSACGSVMGHWAARKDLLADVMQEATCEVIQKIRTGHLPFVDEGEERFSGWLWATWRHACQNAWIRCQSFLTGVERLTEEHLATIAPPVAAEEAPGAQLVEAIQRIEDPLLRQVMADWLAGLSGAESARLQGCSESTVSRCRKRGRAWLRVVLRIRMFQSDQRGRSLRTRRHQASNHGR